MFKIRQLAQRYFGDLSVDITMDTNFDLQSYLTEGVEKIVSDAIKATLKNPKESAFMLKFTLESRIASKKRRESEDRGCHIPPFLIASITSKCNLHCAGCYSRCNNATTDTKPERQLTDDEWLKIFNEAAELGISFILLAGGEPLIRRGVIEVAGKKPNILFPIFTNGTYIDGQYLSLFDKCRNLIPIISIEGNKEFTDKRRGNGIYDKVISNMNEMKNCGLVFGVSITVTTKNYIEVTSRNFLSGLSDRGCKAIIFVEYVPVNEESKNLAPTDREREYLSNAIQKRRKFQSEMIYISFPGDEKSLGGCLSAGRGFFHINSHGGAEPCPFSPYSDLNIRDSSLKDALSSPLFTTLQSGNILSDNHIGGCVLYEKREQVEKIVNG